MSDLAPVAALALGTFLLLLFPTGQLTSPRFRPVAWLAAAALFVMGLGITLGPGTLSSVTGADKPIEIEFPLFSGSDWAWLGTMLALLLAVVSMFGRYRSARTEERQQLRWFLAAAPIFIASFFVIGVGEVLSVLGALGLASLPIAAGIAIFRYRLYDLEVVVQRTLVYGVATVVLAGLYFGIVLALQQVFQSFAGGSDLAVAVSTLAVAALLRNGPAAHPTGSGPSLLPPSLRCSTNPRELRRQPAGRDRPRRARRGAPKHRAGDHGARTGLTLVTAAGHTNVSTRTATRLAWSLWGLSVALAGRLSLLWRRLRLGSIPTLRRQTSKTDGVGFVIALRRFSRSVSAGAVVAAAPSPRIPSAG